MQDDRNFDDECINLLCRQENTLTQLGEARAQQRVFDSIDLAMKMVMEFLDFAELHFDDDHLRDVGQRLHNVFQQTKEQEKRLLGQSFRRLKKLIGMSTPSEDEIAAADQELCDKYAQLYGEFFAICVDRLPPGSETREQFQQGVNAFIRELGGKW